MKYLIPIILFLTACNLDFVEEMTSDSNDINDCLPTVKRYWRKIGIEVLTEQGPNGSVMFAFAECSVDGETYVCEDPGQWAILAEEYICPYLAKKLVEHEDFVPY